MHHLDAQVKHLFCPVLAPALVPGIHPQVRKARKAISCTLQQQFDPVLIGDLGAMDPGFEHQSLRIYQEMALPAANLLPPVVASRFAAYSGCLGRLGIHYPSTGLRVSTQPYTQAFTQSRVQSLRFHLCTTSETTSRRFPKAG